MNIKELKELINDLPDDMDIIMSSDSEGNNYSPLSNVDPNYIYIPDNSWSGDVYSTNWTADDVCMIDDEWLSLKSSHPKVLILHPTR